MAVAKLGVERPEEEALRAEGLEEEVLGAIGPGEKVLGARKLGKKALRVGGPGEEVSESLVAIAATATTCF